MPTTWIPPDPMIPHAAHLPLGTGHGLNAFLLKELVKHYIEGYDDETYMVHINEAYKQLWEEVQQLDEEFFTDITTVSVTVQSDTFDFAANIYNNLSAPLTRMHQIHRIRIQQASSGTSTDNQMYPAEPRDLNDPGYMGASQQQPPSSATHPPYLYVPFGRNSIRFARPLPVGTKIEVWFTYGCIDLTYVNAGSITTTGSDIHVNGTGTNFTFLTTPDLAGALPSSSGPIEQQLLAELIVAGRSYSVVNIIDDLHLDTDVDVPAFTTQPYILASLPQLPNYEHRTIALVATRNLALMGPLEVGGTKGAELNRLANDAIQRMKNTMIQRQRQANAKKRRFPFGVTRRSRYGAS